MEKNERNNVPKFTQYDINLLLEKTLNETWDIFVCDDILLNEINEYIYSEWILKRGIKSQILARFLKNSDDNFDTSNNNWISEFNKFIELIWKDKWNVMNELSENLSLNLFRNKENLKKINYIKNNSDITDDIILIAKNLSVNNWYHNFWHELWVAENVIYLWNNAWLDRKAINLLTLSALFHDAWYNTKYKNIDQEQLACNLVKQYIPDEIFKQLNINKSDVDNLIMMTKITNRKMENNEIIKILQDSDLWNLWHWPYYLLYSCMWMVDEWIISLKDFVVDEKKFILCNMINWNLYLSDVGKNSFENPITTLNVIEQRWYSVIQQAYLLRKQDISFEKFKDMLDNFINQNPLNNKD